MLEHGSVGLRYINLVSCKVIYIINLYLSYFCILCYVFVLHCESVIIFKRIVVFSSVVLQLNNCWTFLRPGLTVDREWAGLVPCVIEFRGVHLTMCEGLAG